MRRAGLRRVEARGWDARRARQSKSTGRSACATKDRDSNRQTGTALMGAGGGGLELGNYGRNGALFIVGEGRKGEPGQAAIKPAHVHGVFDAGDAAFGDDASRSVDKEVLEFSGLLVLAAADEIVEFDALFRKGRGKRQNGPAGPDHESRIEHSSAAREHLKRTMRASHDFAYALNVAGTV